VNVCELQTVVTKCGSEVNLKVRNTVPDITVYLGDRLDRLSTFHGLLIIHVIYVA